LYISKPYPFQYWFNHSIFRDSGGLPEEVMRLAKKAINPGHKQALASKDIFNSSIQIT